MTSFLTSNANGILLPDQVTELVVDPLRQTSVFTQVSTWVGADSDRFRFPIVTEDVSCFWTGEGQALTDSVPTVSELLSMPKKLTALVPISRELAMDSNPAAAAVAGDSVVRSAARNLDLAAFGTNSGNSLQPAGLVDLVNSDVGVQLLSWDTFENLDWAIEAETMLNQVGSTATAFVMSANTLSALAQIKRFETTEFIISNETLIPAEHVANAPDTREPSDALPRQVPRFFVNGTPAYWTLEGVIPDGVIYAIHDRYSFIVVRQDYELIVSPWPMFANDMLLLRFVFRCDFAWPKPQSIVQITGTLPDFDGS
jgi:Phage capsid family